MTNMTNDVMAAVDVTLKTWNTIVSPILMRQVYTGIVIKMLFAGVMAISAIWSYSCYRLEIADRDVMFVATICASVVLAIVLGSAICDLINPEYAALKLAGYIITGR